MDSNLMMTVEDSLKAYSIYVEYWTPDAGDTFILLGHREFLQEHLADLTKEQQALLQATDQRVLALVAVDYAIEDDSDIVTLGWVVEVINSVQKPVFLNA